MTDDQFRTGPARDVPPPRPVSGAPVSPDDGGGLGRAARAVADAVTGLLGAPGDGDGGARTAAGGALRDVLTGVAAAAGALREAAASAGLRNATAGPTGAAGAGRDRNPAALLGDLLAAAVPRLPIRDAERLRAAHPGATDEEIADALVARAARVTSAVGAGAGGLSAAQWFAPPTLVVLPISLGAETVVTAAVEVALIGELHELYGRRPPGDPRERAAAYLAAWSGRRAVDPGASGLVAALGSAGLQELRRRVTRRFARAIPTAAPFLLGAAISGRANRRSTELLADRIRNDLRLGYRPGRSGDPSGRG